MTVAELLVTLIGVYVGIGLLFAIAFVIVGVSRVDPAAKGGPVLFRLFILPGAMLLWPVMAVMWLGAKQNPAASEGETHAA